MTTHLDCATWTGLISNCLAQGSPEEETYLGEQCSSNHKTNRRFRRAGATAPNWAIIARSSLMAFECRSVATVSPVRRPRCSPQLAPLAAPCADGRSHSLNMVLIAVLLYFSSLLPHVVGLIYWNWHTTNPHLLEQATVVAQPTTTIALSCLSDSDCARDSFCDRHYRLCKQRRQLGEPCRSRDQCAHRLDCSFGRCSTTVPPREQGTIIAGTFFFLIPSITGGHLGARCRGDDDCNEGLCCARRHGVRVCKRKLAPMQSCFIPDGGLSYYLNELCPCEDGYVCRSETEMNPSYRLATSFSCRPI